MTPDEVVASLLYRLVGPVPLSFYSRVVL
jgi:hypothetical protein